MKKLKLKIQYFASTNQTTHYNLSQYVANDKPTYLIDYNGDMLKIDNAIYTASTKALEVESNVGNMTDLTTTNKSSLVNALNEVNSQVGTNTGNISQNTLDISDNSTKIGSLTDLSTTYKTNLVGAVNEVNSKVGNLNNLTTEVKNNIVSAINETRKSLDVSVKKSYINATEVNVTNGNLSSIDVKIAKSTNEDIGKIYGKINFTATYSVADITLSNDTINTDSDYGIDGIVIIKDNTSNSLVDITNLNIKSNNTLYIFLPNITTGNSYTVTIIPCLLYFKSFGDIPTPSSN